MATFQNGLKSALYALAVAGAVLCAVGAAAPAAHAQSAAVVLDARTGDVLLAENADRGMPAPALPKLMTIYLMFEAFEAGTVRPETNIFVSGEAVGQPQPKLGLAEFDTIKAGQALDALLAASANDAAAVLAQFLAGSEARFVETMNAKAKELGLTNTRFANISGAPDPKQYSTPRDMIRFSLALMRTFPQRAQSLVGIDFAWRGQTFRGPKNFLSALSQGSGATGVNRARSAQVNGRDVIAVVWNAADGESADALLSTILEKAQNGVAVASTAPSVSMSTNAPASAPIAAGGWGVQLGAFSTEAAARAQIAKAALLNPELASAKSVIEPLQRPAGTLYRAQYTGIDEAAAQRICAAMKAAGAGCLALTP